MSRLDDDQLVAFDTEYVGDRQWPPIREGLDRLPDAFSFLDLGGGNGVFSDRVLEAYPQASGIVGDNATVLLERHEGHPRKKSIEVDALRLPLEELGRFDVVFLNWILHHLVETGDYDRTRANIVRVLTDVRWLLRPGGRVSVFENMYDGAVLHNAPSHLVFAATSSRRLAPLTRRMGANTAGVGVCFQSEASWRSIFAESGYEIESFTADETWPIGRPKRVALMLRRVRFGQFWLRPTGP